MEFYTIGVYNTGEADFFTKLTENGIDTFADIRQRRGVRGKSYSFANSRRLQQKLQVLNIRYDHVSGLAPTAEIRKVQEENDRQKKESRKERRQISEAFTEAYKKIIIERFDFEAYLQGLAKSGAKKIVLFCVEEHAEACHRSIVADKLKLLGYNTTHL